MPIKSDKELRETFLEKIPTLFRKKIISEYTKIKQKYTLLNYNDDFDNVGISVGKFTETLLRFIQKEVTGQYIPFGKKIGNLPNECRKIIEYNNSTCPDSLRIIMPRSLVFLYTIRNKRGIGHVGGDIEANKIDIRTIVNITDWCVCELIRIYHNTSIEEAQSIIDSWT